MRDFSGFVVLRDLSRKAGGAKPQTDVFATPRGTPGDVRSDSVFRGVLGGPAKTDDIKVDRSAGMPANDPSNVAIFEELPLTAVMPLRSEDLKINNNAVIKKAKLDRFAWGVRALGADKSQYTGKGATVAVLDTGINRQHEAFSKIPEIVEKDFTGEGNGDTDGHGTHVAGTIFGGMVGGVDGVRIGIAPGIQKALIGKVIPTAGTGALLKALHWAMDEGANIIAMSLGFDYVNFLHDLTTGPDAMPMPAATSLALNRYRDNLRAFDAFMELAAAMGDKAPLIVAATGNEADRPAYLVSKSSPAAAIGVVSVGAVEELAASKYKIAKFSNADPDFVAPGVGIVSASHKGKNGLAVMNGTSQACPHIAGLAALYYEMYKNAGAVMRITPQLLASQLNATASAKIAAHFEAPDPRDVGYGMPIAP